MQADCYLVNRRAAWFAFAMTLALMVFDYIDRQVIVSLFPYLKAEWALSDKQLGGRVSVVSVIVAIGNSHFVHESATSCMSAVCL